MPSKTIRFIPLALLALACAAPVVSGEPKKAPAPTEASGSVSSAALVQRMGLGWNLGNTMEACGDWIKGGTVSAYETAWGAPETSQAIIAAVKKAGFSSVRIPVAWSNLAGPDHSIDPLLMARVQQIVDWTLAEGLIAVVNIHWDGGWWEKFPEDYQSSMKRYTTLWAQIAARFKDYPETLIFESLNEEACFNKVWDRYKPGAPGKERAYQIANNINQTFVTLVRNSGGKNGQRHLLIAGYCTDVELTVDPAFHMPKDPAGRSIVSVHYYTPFVFAGLKKDESWGKMRSTWGTPADLAEMDANFGKLKARFIDQGVPVIMGEYGSEKENKDPASVRRYLLTAAEKMVKLGICPMLWDANSHFNRRTLKWEDPELGEGFKKMSQAK